MSENVSLVTALRGRKAKEKWEAGRHEWNKWVGANPEAVVDFSGEVLFPQGETDELNFEGYVFPSGDGRVDFSNVKFGAKRLNFRGVSFGAGLVIFNAVSLACKNVDFRYCIFEGPVQFSNLSDLEGCGWFSFEGSQFKKFFSFSHNGKLGCPLDLRQTSFQSQALVDDLSCEFSRNDFPKIPNIKHWVRDWDSLYFLAFLGGQIPTRGAKDKDDCHRFRRLKELALASRNYPKALEFNVLEIQSRRPWHSNWKVNWVEYLYALWGDYGRSVTRPLCWLFGLWMLSGLLLFDLRGKFDLSVYEGGLAALTLSGSNMLSFIPSGRTARNQGELLLFGEIVPSSILLLQGFQSTLAVILLFLLGLGLRNLFRV